MSVTSVGERHGDATQYKRGCRCRPCTAAATRADAERKLDRLRGRPRTVDAARVTRHVQRLVTAGMSHTQIAQAAGVAQSSVSMLAAGRRKTVYAVREARLLSVGLDDRTEKAMTSALGSVRRLRALYVLGHGPSRLAAELGVHRDTITQLAAGLWSRISLGRDIAIREVYDRLSMVHGTSAEARRWAVRQGWYPPLAWDDDTIDAPGAQPAVDASVPAPARGQEAAHRFLMGEAVVLDDTARREVIRYLMEWSTETPDEIGERLGLMGSSVSRSWERIKNKARAEGGKVPWRRVYIPQRDLERDEMESAA